MIGKLLDAGMNVARLNFSHGTHEQHAEVIKDLRALAREKDRPLAILQDLSGPKVRLGDFGPSPHLLERGQMVAFAADVQPGEVDDSRRSGRPGEDACLLLPLPLPALLNALHVGNTLLLDDGKIELTVAHCSGDAATARRTVWATCRFGGEIKSKKGVTAMAVSFEVPAVTEKDLTDLRFGLTHGVDWVAASYVRTAEDVEPIFETMREMNIFAPVIAKIEKFEAVKNLHSILSAVDGIMVARGDLGVETPFDEVPIVQKRIIRACNRVGKPVITATQMLESMILSPRPTRAEATDVANAILDGTDAVMLSGETAAGLFPVEAVETMSKIAIQAEAAFFKEPGFEARLQPPRDVTESVARASAHIASELNAAAILCATSSGGTAVKVAQYRPKVRIMAVTMSERTYRRLALNWGVESFLATAVTTTDAMIQATIDAAKASGHIRKNERVVLTAGVPVNNPGTTNLIKVHTVGTRLDPNSVPMT